MSGYEHIDSKSVRELEYIATIYIQHDELDKAAEVMALAERIERRTNNFKSNIEWLDSYRIRRRYEA